MLFKDIYGRDKISDYLPVVAYDPGKKLYFCDKDSSAGFILEVMPIYFTNRAFYESIGAYLNAKWPKNTLLQFTLYADPNLDPVLMPYRRLRGREFDPEIALDPTRSFLHKWANSYADYLESIKYTGIEKDEAPVPFRNFRCFCSAKIPCSEVQFASGSSDIERLLENRDEIMAGFKTCHMSAGHLHPDMYLAFMYQLWNPGHPLPTYFPPESPDVFTGEVSRPLIKWDMNREISKQIVEKDTIIVRRPKSVDIDGWKIRSKTLVGLPQSIEPIDINLFIGDIGRANKKQITTPFLLTMTLDANSQNSLVTKQGNLVLGQQAPLPGLRPRVEKRKNELLRANAILDEGGKFTRGMMSITLLAQNNKKLESASAAIDAIWKQRGFQLQNEAGLHLPLFMLNQPLGASCDMVDKFVRTFPAPTNSFAFCVPIQADNNSGSSAGVSPVFLLVSRRGQIVGHDLRDSPKDYNAVVIAPSGSGKSFFVNYLATNNYSIGGRNFIIDIGRSYEKLCSTMEGQFIEFTPNSNISLNIFALMTPELWLSEDKPNSDDDDSADDPKARLRETCEILLHQMVSPKEAINANEKAILGNVLGECFDDLALIWRKKRYALDMAGETIENFLNVLESQKEYLENAREATPQLADKTILPSEAFSVHMQFDDLPDGEDDFDPAKMHEVQSMTVSKWLRSIGMDTIRSSVSYKFYTQQIAALNKFLGSYVAGDKDLSDISPLGYDRLHKFVFNIRRILLSEKVFSMDMMIKKLTERQDKINSDGQADSMPMHLAQRLVPFSSTGKYSKWFKDDFNIAFERPFVVLELEELAQFDDLKQVVMILVLSSIEHKIYITPDRSRPTYVIMDEAWDLLVGENTASFIEKAYRRFRKYGASIITITQSIFDLVDKNKSVGMAVLNNSSWKFFLGPNESEVERANAEHIFPVNTLEKQLMTSAHTVRGLYSEVVYRDPYGILRLARLHVDKRTMLLYSTHPLEVELLHKVRREGKLNAWNAMGVAVPYISLLHETSSSEAVMARIRADLQAATQATA